MRFAPIEKKRIAEQIADSLREAILGGELEPGDALPSERTLAERFAVNRSGVREALTKLEAWGLLEIQHGGVTRIKDFLTTAGLQLLPFIIAPGGIPNMKRLYDLLELRVALLEWTARKAVLKHPGETEKLEKILARMEAPEADAAQLEKADFDFFEELVRLTENSILKMLTHAIRQVYEKQRKLFIRFYHKSVFDPSKHREFIECHKRGAAEQAAKAMSIYAETALNFMRGKHE